MPTMLQGQEVRMDWCCRAKVRDLATNGTTDMNFCHDLAADTKSVYATGPLFPPRDVKSVMIVINLTKCTIVRVSYDMHVAN